MSFIFLGLLLGIFKAVMNRIFSLIIFSEYVLLRHIYIYVLVIFTIRFLFILERCHICGGEDNFQLSFYYIDPGDPTWSSDLVTGNIAY